MPLTKDYLLDRVSLYMTETINNNKPYYISELDVTSMFHHNSGKFDMICNTGSFVLRGINLTDFRSLLMRLICERHGENFADFA